MILEFKYKGNANFHQTLCKSQELTNFITAINSPDA